MLIILILVFSMKFASSLILNKIQINSLVRRIIENNLITDKMLQSEFVPFVVDNDVLGYCKSDFAKLLESYKDIFVINNQNKIEFLHNFKNFDERTKAIAKVTLSLKEKGKITGWRDELFPVCDNFSSQPKFLIERAAYASFGTRGYGIHLNGYVKNIYMTTHKIFKP